MAKFSQEDDALLKELGVEVEANRTSTHTPREERIIAGFEEIQRFVEENGRLPQHGEDRDIFERLYAVRLDRIREQAECRSLVEPLDHQGLLAAANDAAPAALDEIDDDKLLAALGVEVDAADLTVLKHVRSNAEKRAAEEIATRERCADFERFKPLFDQVRLELNNGVRQSKRIRKDAGFLKADIHEGRFFILGGQTAYIAVVGETFKAPNGENDARLRVIFSNGTESDLLLRSMQRALYDDEASRLITDPSMGPLFEDFADEEDLASGTVYVLRSKSDHPLISENRELLHKIGVTGGKVETRLANASLDPTFLMAEVEIIATYALYNVKRVKLENLIHRVFDAARLDIEIKDRFGNPVKPREWFLVPLFVVNEAVERIKDGTIIDYVYDPKAARLVKIRNN